jgi:hypothetical protein
VRAEGARQCGCWAKNDDCRSTRSSGGRGAEACLLCCREAGSAGAGERATRVRKGGSGAENFFVVVGRRLVRLRAPIGAGSRAKPGNWQSSRRLLGVATGGSSCGWLARVRAARFGAGADAKADRSQATRVAGEQVQCARRNLRDEQVVSATWSGDEADKVDDEALKRPAPRPSTAIITSRYLHGNGRERQRPMSTTKHCTRTILRLTRCSRVLRASQRHICVGLDALIR